jgi:hypothetical protein
MWDTGEIPDSAFKNGVSPQKLNNSTRSIARCSRNSLRSATPRPTSPIWGSPITTAITWPMRASSPNPPGSCRRATATRSSPRGRQAPACRTRVAEPTRVKKAAKAIRARRGRSQRTPDATRDICAERTMRGPNTPVMPVPHAECPPAPFSGRSASFADYCQNSCQIWIFDGSCFWDLGTKWLIYNGYFERSHAGGKAEANQ